MEYRRLGRTNLEVSELGLGCEGFIEGDEAAEKMLNRAMDAGINFLDLYSPAPDVRSMLGRVMASRKEHLILQAHLCSVWKNGQYERSRKIEDVQAGFEDLLARLDVDKVDIGMIHYVDQVADWEEIEHGPIMRYAKEQQAAGRIGYIGVSSHNPDAAIRAVESGLIDVLMFSVNPCYDLQPPDEVVDNLWAPKSYENALVNMDPTREKLYELCAQRDVAITVMKAFGGGDLLSAKDSPAGVALTAAQCISYALGRPGVDAVMAGVRSEEDLTSLLAYESASEQEKDYASALASFPRISWEGHCMYCGHCAPCPKQIDVAMVMKLYSLGKDRQEIPETVRSHYELLDAHASDCMKCGACESRCPFGVHIREELDRAETLFGE